MASFGSLEIGKKGLIAQRLGLDVTSNNIANVNTPGYSRRQALLSETDPRYTVSGYIGTGVVSDSLRSFRQEFIDKEVRSASARQAYYESDERIYSRLETILDEPSDNGINETVAKFLNAFQTLSTKPEDYGLRENVLSLAKTLVDRFHNVASDVQSARQELGVKLNTSVDQINEYISSIADLNAKIGQTNARSGSDAQTYVDERENVIEKLSSLAGVSISQMDNGMINVYINGINVVTNNVASKLSLKEDVDNTSGERNLRLVKVDSTGKELSTILPDSGEIASELKHYNITLDSEDSSGGFSVMKQINDFAAALVQKVNEQSVTGYGLDDTTAGPPPGRTFFEPSIGNVTAANIAISPDIANPRDIPLSDAPNEPGNNEIARKIANIANDKAFLNGFTPSEYFSGFLGKLGTYSSESSSNKDAAKIMSTQLTNERESVIGVNLDEEAVSLIKFQRAYEASSRVIKMANEVLQTVVNLDR